MLTYKARRHLLCPPKPHKKFIHSCNNEWFLPLQVLETADPSLPRPGLTWGDFQPSGFSCPQDRPKSKGALEAANWQERKWCLGQPGKPFSPPSPTQFPFMVAPELKALDLGLKG